MATPRLIEDLQYEQASGYTVAGHPLSLIDARFLCCPDTAGVAGERYVRIRYLTPVARQYVLESHPPELAEHVLHPRADDRSEIYSPEQQLAWRILNSLMRVIGDNPHILAAMLDRQSRTGEPITILEMHGAEDPGDNSSQSPPVWRVTERGRYGKPVATTQEAVEEVMRSSEWAGPIGILVLDVCNPHNGDLTSGRIPAVYVHGTINATFGTSPVVTMISQPGSEQAEVLDGTSLLGE